MSFQQNRRHEKTVGTHKNVPLLEVDVISTIYPNEQVLYTVRMTDLDLSEVSLNAGRFAQYVNAQQEFVFENLLGSQEIKFSDLFVPRRNWIAAHVTDSWNFDIEIPHLGADARCLIKWSFKSLNDALLFKLSF